MPSNAYIGEFSGIDIRPRIFRDSGETLFSPPFGIFCVSVNSDDIQGNSTFPIYSIIVPVMKKTLFPLSKELFEKLRNANSEATVRQRVVEALDCDDIQLEEGRTDAFHKNILFEFKLDEDMQHPEGVRSQILAQTLYYCHNFYIDGKPVPPHVVPIDKDEFVFYNRTDPDHIYKDESLFQQGNASNPEAAVIEKCKRVAPYRIVNRFVSGVVFTATLCTFVPVMVEFNHKGHKGTQRTNPRYGKKSIRTGKTVHLHRAGFVGMFQVQDRKNKRPRPAAERI
jgi:hypothetical protein